MILFLVDCTHNCLSQRLNISTIIFSGKRYLPQDTIIEPPLMIDSSQSSSQLLKACIQQEAQNDIGCFDYFFKQILVLMIMMPKKFGRSRIEKQVYPP